jgi:hypothetical protein
MNTHACEQCKHYTTGPIDFKRGHYCDALGDREFDIIAGRHLPAYDECQDVRDAWRPTCTRYAKASWWHRFDQRLRSFS